jgi:hypothetical protein
MLAAAVRGGGIQTFRPAPPPPPNRRVRHQEFTSRPPGTTSPAECTSSCSAGFCASWVAPRDRTRSYAGLRTQEGCHLRHRRIASRVESRCVGSRTRELPPVSNRTRAVPVLHADANPTPLADERSARMVWRGRVPNEIASSREIAEHALQLRNVGAKERQRDPVRTLSTPDRNSCPESVRFTPAARTARKPLRHAWLAQWRL